MGAGRHGVAQHEGGAAWRAVQQGGLGSIGSCGVGQHGGGTA